MWPLWCPASVSWTLPVHHSLVLTANISCKSCLPGAENKFLLTFNLRTSGLSLGDTCEYQGFWKISGGSGSTQMSQACWVLFQHPLYLHVNYNCTWVAWVLFLALAFHPHSSNELLIDIISFTCSLCKLQMCFAEGWIFPLFLRSALRALCLGRFL